VVPVAFQAPVAQHAGPATDLVVRAGHTGVVTAIAVSADGSRVLSGSADHLVKLWDGTTGRELRSFSGHGAHGVTGVALSPDGRLGVSGGHDATAKLWDLDTGRLLQEIRVPRSRSGYAGARVAFSTDGRHLLTGGGDELQVREVPSGRVIQRLGPHDRHVVAVAYSPDGRFVASGTTDGDVWVWEVASGRQACRWREHTDWVHALSFSADGRRLYSAGADRTARVWDLETGRPGPVFTDPSQWMVGAGESPGGRWVVTASSQMVRVWDRSTGQEVRSMASPGTARAALSADGRRLLTGRWDGTLTVWDVASGAAAARLTEGVSRVRDLAFGPDGKWLLAASAEGSIRHWDLTAGVPIRALAGHRGEVHALVVSPDRRWAASGGEDGTARLWELSTGREVISLATGAPVTAVALAPDGTQILTGSDTGAMTLWSVMTGQALRHFPAQLPRVRGIVFAPDGQTAVSWSRSWGGMLRSVVRTWDLTSGRVRRELSREGVSSFVLAPDGSWAIDDAGFGELRLWDLVSGRVQRSFQGHRSWATGAAVSADGLTLLTGGMDHSLRLWDVTTGSERATLSTTEALPRYLALSADGSLAASVGDGATIRLWDVTARRELVRLVAFTDGWVASTPDGHYRASPEGEARLLVRSGDALEPIDAHRAARHRPDRVVDALKALVRP
jgi:WD40 repeat protein